MCKIYLSFTKIKKPKDRKTDIWEVFSMNKIPVGLIKFNGAWRQFIFEPADTTFWSYSCLEQIVEFLKEKNLEWRKKHARM